MASKADIIDAVAGKHDKTTKSDVKNIVDSFLETLAEELASGSGKVQLTGFGTFEVRERKERSGVRPGTTERITIPASKYPAFKPGKQLKDKVQG